MDRMNARVAPVDCEPCPTPFCRNSKAADRPFCRHCWMVLLDAENRERVFLTYKAVVESEVWELASAMADHEEAIKKAMRSAASVREHMRVLRCDAERARESVRAGRELARLLAEEM